MKKTERIGLVLLPAEKTVALQLADAAGGLTVSALVRRLIRLVGQAEGLWPPADSSSDRATCEGEEPDHD